MKRINGWRLRGKWLCVMLTALMGVCLLFHCNAANAVLLPEEFIKYRIWIDRPNSTLSMYIQSEGEYSYVMGQDKETLQHWLALIAGHGEIKWQVTNALPEYYCGATEINGIAYILVSRMGIPIEERTPYLQPITRDGIKQEPITLPSWVADATMIKSSDSLLFFSRRPQPLTIAEYDQHMVPVWEKQVTVGENMINYFMNVVETDEGYALLGPSRYGQDAVLSQLDWNGHHLWTKTYAGMGWVSATPASQGRLILLCEQADGQDAARRYSLLVLDSDDATVDQHGLEIPEESIELRGILMLSNGILACGARQYGDKAPEIVLLFLDDAYQVQFVADVPQLKDTISQISLTENGMITLLGIGTGDNGQASGYVTGYTIDIEALRLWLTTNE